jgi:hypothetical protein
MTEQKSALAAQLFAAQSFAPQSFAAQPFLRSLPPECIARLAETVRHVSVPAGHRLSDEDSPARPMRTPPHGSSGSSTLAGWHSTCSCRGSAGWSSTP